MIFRQATHFDFPEIIEILEEINLDMEDIDPDQFVVCEIQKSVVGIGRIRDNEDALELCSLGVLDKHRGKGAGKGLMNMLLQNYPKDELFVVTDIPDFFKKFGFEISTDFPESIERKQKVCLSELNCTSAQVMHLFV